MIDQPKQQSTGLGPIEEGAFGPFRNRAFLVLWTATVAGNIGGWVRDTGSAWMMTELAPSPLTVSLVQAASTLPVFLLSLPAGALSDIIDRRGLMIAVQFGLACVSAALLTATLTGVMTPALLVIFTLCAGIGAALAGPVWQSIVPGLVVRDQLKSAVALNSLGVNLSRAIGPVIGGGLILALGVWAAYAFDFVTYGVTLAALIWWRPAPKSKLRPERLTGAMQAGARYALSSPPLQRVLLRGAIFLVPASAYWALLPLVSRQDIGGGAGAYGILLGGIGAGAVGAALVLPRLRRRVGDQILSVLATLATAIATAGLALSSDLLSATLILIVTGAAWITMVTTLNGTAQAVLPDWVRGRGLAVYLTVFFGTMTFGAVAWGQVAALTSVDAALLAASAIGLIGAILAARFRLPSTEADLSPTPIWPEAVHLEEARGSDGPMMITVPYRVDPADHTRFAAAMLELGRIRRRDGAYAWGVLKDSEDPWLITEWFMVASIDEHMRQHARALSEDAPIRDRVRAYHRGQVPPTGRHLIPL